ncbi:MAG: hypothetical protein DRN66_00515 [Candidatus Nanohalarchaeota archaeon]|nr:MAG: hypothetical protein DRN66_00515 [Candidatus Nanohaloarchaeota archaeon]
MEKEKYIINEVIRISPLRVGALIGKGGSFKRQMEEQLDAKLVIDGKDGTVMCFMNDYDAYRKLTDIVMAISRGFSSDVASVLLKNDFIFHQIKLGKNKTQNVRQKARIIGTDGKTKKNMELITSTKISIYGKSISIVGRGNDVILCHRAIRDILNGAKQNVVLSVLKRKKEEEISN